MNRQELEGLLRQLMQGITEVMQSGETLSDEFQGLLAQTLGNLYNRIEQSSIEEQNIQQTQRPSDNIIEPSISNDAQLLWILSGQQPQAFISYLRTYPTKDTQQLLNNPSLLNETIEQLNRMIPQGETNFINGIPRADLNSSNIWGAAYDPRSGKMRVRFQGGSEYEYDGVPQNIFRAFIKGNASAKTSGQNQYGKWWKNKSPTLGGSFHQYIKLGGFPYKKIR